MKRPTVCAWSSLVTLAILAAMLASCGGAATTTPPTGATTPPTSSAPPTTTTAAASVPTHGGQLVQVLATDPSVFDPAVTSAGGSILCDYVYESLFTSDWLRGTAGSNITDYTSGANYVEDYYGLQGLAESWTMPSQGVWVIKIRQGVRWQQTNTPAGSLMGGRELTVDDLVYNFNRLKDPRSWGMVSQTKMMNAASFEKTGPWEVTIKTPVDPWTAFVWLIYTAGFYRVFPTEVCKKYGDVSDWHNAVGTGPFILKDFVSGSSMTFAKNPTYWDTDPIGPGKGNKVPYVDAL